MKAETVVKRTARAFSNTFSAKDSALELVDILDTLKQEHDEAKALPKNLSKAETAAQRRSLVQKINAAHEPHSKAEEKVVCDALIALRDEAAEMDGHEGYLEHEWASKTLQRLGRCEEALLGLGPQAHECEVSCGQAVPERA
jgi:phage gp16-like protein